MQRLNSLIQNVQSLNDKVKLLGSCQVQKIYSSVNALCLVLRFAGETERLWLGRGGAVEGVLYPGPLCPAGLRVKDRFLELHRSTLKGSKIIEVKVYGEGHFVIRAMKKNYKITCVYSWAEGKLYYSSLENDAGEPIVFSPWRDSKRRIDKTIENDESLIDLHEKSLKAKIRSPMSEKDCGGAIDTHIKKLTNKKKKFYERKLKNIKKDLEKVLLADEVQKWASSLKQSELPGPFAEFKGIKVKFRNALSFYQKRDIIYQKAKSFRQAQTLLLKRLEDAKREYENLSEEVTSVALIDKHAKPKLPVWIGHKEDKKSSTQLSLEDVVIYEGIAAKLGVGLNAKANDALRNSWAKKSDIWFHLDSQVGPHGFLKLQEDNSLSVEAIEGIASAILYHSKVESTEIDLVYTRVKYLKSVKGKAGLVRYSNEKRIRVKYRTDWKEILANL